MKSFAGHFIRIIRSEIYLVHQTAREFLLGSQQPGGVRERTSLHTSQWQHSITMEDVHRALLVACVSYLACGERSPWDEFSILTKQTFARWVPPSASVSLQLRNSTTKTKITHQNPHKEHKDLLQAGSVGGTGKLRPTSFDRCVSIHPFLWYASTYWTFPFEFSELDPSGTLFTQVMDFCQIVPDGLGYPVWTEARSNFLCAFEGSAGSAATNSSASPSRRGYFLD